MRKQVNINSLHPLMKLYLKHIPEDGMITYLKLDRLEIPEEEAEEMYQNLKDHIWAYRTLYRVIVTEDLKLDLIREHRNPKDTCPVTKRGRYFWMDSYNAYTYRKWK